MCLRPWSSRALSFPPSHVQLPAGRAALAADLERGRARGYQLTRGENVADVMALAAIVDLNGLSFGIALAGPIHRMAPNEAALARELLAARNRMEVTA